MANVCRSYAVRGCPASLYMSCPAYLGGKNCWEVPRRPCCPADNLATCAKCEVLAIGRAIPKGNLG